MRGVLSNYQGDYGTRLFLFILYVIVDNLSFIQRFTNGRQRDRQLYRLSVPVQGAHKRNSYGSFSCRPLVIWGLFF